MYGTHGCLTNLVTSLKSAPFWALGVGVPFDPDKVRMDGSAQSEPARSEAGCIQIKARRKATGAFSRAGP